MLSSAAGGCQLYEKRLADSSAGRCLHQASQNTKWKPQCYRGQPQKKRKLAQNLIRAAASGLTGERVRIVTKDSSRVKRILAEVQVQATVEQIWSVLTNYNKLASFVPNLEHCERVSGAPPGKQRLLQRASSQSIFCRLQAEAVLDVQEVIMALGRRELVFTMVSGDFQEFSGRWILEPDPSVRDGRSLATILKYEVNIVPKWNLPSTLVAAVIRCGLPANVDAIVKRAEQMAETRRGAPKFAKAAFQESQVNIPQPVAQIAATLDELLPEKGPPRTTPEWLSKAAKAASDFKGRILGDQGVAYLGLKSVPVPLSGWQQGTSKSWEKLDLPPMSTPGSQLEANDRAKGKEQSETGNGPAGQHLLQKRWKSTLNSVMDVHLRRLDDAFSVKRRAVASIQIEASRKDVWNALTDYEKLPEFVPGLAVCERLPAVEGAPPRLVRLRQVGFKSLMYMHLHAETTLALVESPYKEVQFKQIRGDFQTLQGKFMMTNETIPGVKSWNEDQFTVLRYAIDVEIPRSTRMLGLLEPLLEQAVYEDIPTNLRAIKLHIEQLKANEQKKIVNNGVVKPSASEMCEDFSLLVEELERTFGSEELPERRTIRKMHRNDLEVAVAHHGGMRAVTKRIRRVSEDDSDPEAGTQESQDNLEVVEQAFEEYGKEKGLPLYCLPSVELMARSQRNDLVRMARTWGGVEALSELLGYRVVDDHRPSSDHDEDSPLASKTNRRPARRRLLASFDLLSQELRDTFGAEGPLPSSTELRAMKRHDLDAAVSHHGGVALVSERLGWRSSKGYKHWSDLSFCKKAIDEFNMEHNRGQATLPTVYSMQQAGRHDLSRAVRVWGGASKLAQALGYKYEGEFSISSKTEQKSTTKSSKKTPQKSKLREEIDSW